MDGAVRAAARVVAVVCPQWLTFGEVDGEGSWEWATEGGRW